jgi:protein TonB
MPRSAATAGLIQSLSAERALYWCVLASITLHAMVLLALSSYAVHAPQDKAPLVLTARLTHVAAAPHAFEQPPRSESLPPPPREPTLAPRPASNKSTATPTQTTQKLAPTDAVNATQPEAAPAAPSAAMSPAQPIAPVQARPVTQATARAFAPEAAAKSGNEADTGTLEQYRMALIVSARRYKRYPAIALEKGWQGRVEVRMVIGADGMIANTVIKAGSGHEILDSQALDMLKKGKSAVPIPASLRGREFNVDVPVIFNLENPGS